MSRLKVLLRGALISEIELNPEKEYIGGRKDGSDIRLQAEKGISREHFKLKMSEGRWQVQAISRFGEIFSLGQKVEDIYLEHGQIFQVPPYEFQLLDIPDSDIPSPKGNVPYEEVSKTVVGAAPQVPYIKMVNSKNQVTEMLRLEVGDLWVAGRDPSCQIVIPDQRVSRRQFEIHKTNGVFTILDLGSVNGTFLNGATVSSTDPQPLKSGDAITVLDNTIYFELHDPNFKYKVDKIDIPSIPLELPQAEESLIYEGEQADVEGNSQLPVEIPEVPADNLSEQMNMNAGGGPFTGIPPQSDPNQFYNFTPPVDEPKKPGLSKVMIITLAAGLIGAAVYFSGLLDEPPQPAVVAENEGDAFNKLSPKKREEIKELYTLADQMLTQQKYDLAIEKLRKIHQDLPNGYKDSLAMMMQAEQSLKNIEQAKEDEKRLQEEEEQRKMFVQVAARCEKLLTPNVEVDDVKQCFAPVTVIDPTNSEYVRILNAAEKIVMDRNINAQEKKTYAEQVTELKQLFADAEKIHAKGYAFKAIKGYQGVVDRKELPDPANLKNKAKSRIVFIKSKIEEKTQRSISEADKLFQEGKLKQSVIFLREASIYDPENKAIKWKIDAYTEELRRQMMVLYQESVIDESYGIVDNSETRQGAKDKWRKIVESDLEDGEYYKKAIIKLRKYGVM